MDLWKTNDKEQNSKLAELSSKRKNSRIITNTFWDRVFGGLYKGGVSAVFACNGIGKTTLLVAMAKELSLKFNVLYVSTETDILTMYQRYDLEGYNMLCTYIKNDQEIEELKNVILDNSIDILVYDYLGSLEEDVSDWSHLRSGSKNWAQFAIDNDIAILTAGQADSKLQLNGVRTQGIDTPQDISFSKHMNDKFIQGGYLIREDRDLYICKFKDRYGDGKVPSARIPIDMKSKTLNKF